MSIWNSLEFAKEHSKVYTIEKMKVIDWLAPTDIYIVQPTREASHGKKVQPDYIAEKSAWESTQGYIFYKLLLYKPVEANLIEDCTKYSGNWLIRTDCLNIYMEKWVFLKLANKRHN